MTNKGLKNNTNKDVYFSIDDVFDIISEILKNNEIKETLIDSVFAEDDNDSLIDIVFLTTKDFAKKELSENDFINALENKLKITNQKAKNIIEEIKQRILPFAEIITIEENKDKEVLDMPKLEQPIEVKKVLSVPEKLKTEVNVPKKIEKNIKPLKKTKEPKIKPIKKSDKQDTYREPIE